MPRTTNLTLGFAAVAKRLYMNKNDRSAAALSCNLTASRLELSLVPAASEWPDQMDSFLATLFPTVDAQSTFVDKRKTALAPEGRLVAFTVGTQHMLRARQYWDVVQQTNGVSITVTIRNPECVLYFAEGNPGRNAWENLRSRFASWHMQSGGYGVPQDAICWWRAEAGRIAVAYDPRRTPREYLNVFA